MINFFLSVPSLSLFIIHCRPLAVLAWLYICPPCPVCPCPLHHCPVWVGDSPKWEGVQVANVAASPYPPPPCSTSIQSRGAATNYQQSSIISTAGAGVKQFFDSIFVEKWGFCGNFMVKMRRKKKE